MVVWGAGWGVDEGGGFGGFVYLALEGFRELLRLGDCRTGGRRYGVGDSPARIAVRILLHNLGFAGLARLVGLW